MPLLEIKDMKVAYGRIEALHGISLSVEDGELVTLIGANGAGKTTTMRAISGIRPLSHGSIVFDGQDITRMRAFKRVIEGIVQAPEGRGVFPGMTVQENLDMGHYGRKFASKTEYQQTLDRVFELFPRLAERRTQVGGTMSGGEQQMVAIGRALASRPRLVLLDEPSGGLSPQLVAETARTLSALRGRGLTLLLVEQNLGLALKAADRYLVLRDGVVAQGGAVRELAGDYNDLVRAIYL